MSHPLLEAHTQAAAIAAWLRGDATDRAALVADYAAGFDEASARALKAVADQALRQAIQQSQAIAEFSVALARANQQPAAQAVGLLAWANALAIGLGAYREALERYDLAVDLFDQIARPADAAAAQVGKVWALACLGRIDEAFAVGAGVAEVLRAHERWQQLATLTLNLAAIAGRSGRDGEALAQFDQAAEIYRRLGAEGAAMLPLVEQNRSIVLRNLGCFELALQAGYAAYDTLIAQQQPIEAARAQQNLGFTYFLQGRSAEALDLLDRARTTFSRDGREHDALLVDLSISDCLLSLRRFREALRLCAAAQPRLEERGTAFEVGQALSGMARANVGLGDYPAALAALHEAEGRFEAAGHVPLATASRLARAEIQLAQGHAAAAFSAALECAEVFAALGLPLREAEAHLLAARAAPDPATAHARASEAQQIATSAGAPALLPACAQVIGRAALAAHDAERAFAAFAQAAAGIEAICGGLMVEHRADFLSDKHSIYADMVALCLRLHRPEEALEYAERARSRSLRDLLASRLDLRLVARHPEDAALVAELHQLQAERDRQARRWATRLSEREDQPSEAEQREAQAALADLEQQITASWHRLLLHNADYARDADLWQVRYRPFQHNLAEDEALIEFFLSDQSITGFVVTRAGVQAKTLAASPSEIARMERLWRLNLRSVADADPTRRAELTQSAQLLLGRLDAALLAPLRGWFAAYPRLIIVAHGLLHYLPFHAMHDGSAFLCEHHEIRYLPSGSLLARSEGANTGSEVLVMGHSAGGALPFAPQEAATVAALFGTPAHCEADATLDHFRRVARSACLIHLAAHGDFRSDSPLFSGVALDDGWLTTLALFDTRLQASLVTLSACATGRSVVSGGDELLGLMRALLYSGAESLIVSLWTVEDLSTANLMVQFYRELSAGTRKAAALRHAQRHLMRDPALRHPYFWAAFILVGGDGILGIRD